MANRLQWSLPPLYTIVCKECGESTPSRSAKREYCDPCIRERKRKKRGAEMTYIPERVVIGMTTCLQRGETLKQCLLTHFPHVVFLHTGRDEPMQSIEAYEPDAKKPESLTVGFLSLDERLKDFLAQLFSDAIISHYQPIIPPQWGSGRQETEG